MSQLYTLEGERWSFPRREEGRRMNSLPDGGTTRNELFLRPSGQIGVNVISLTRYDIERSQGKSPNNAP